MHSSAHFGHTSPKGGLVGLFSFDAVGWLLGGSASLLSRIVFTVVGVAAVCAIPGLCGAGGNSQTGAE